MSHTAAQWHYIVATGQHGPVPVAEMAALVRAGTVRGDTMVWGPGMADWLPFARSPLAREIPLPGAASGYPQPGYPQAGYAQPGYAQPGNAQPGYPQPGASPAGADSFQGAVRTCLTKYATFSGRARRPEFWWFVLFSVLGGFATAVVDMAVFGAGISPLNGVFNLAMLVPGLAAGARRLHDTDRTGWWQLMWFVPLVGWIVLIVFWAQRETPGANRFG